MSEMSGITFSRSTDVVCADIGDGVALLDMTTNSYFSLNDVGAFVWELLASSRTRGQIIEAVTAAYDVARTECEADVDQLIEELHHAALIRSEGQIA